MQNANNFDPRSYPAIKDEMTPDMMLAVAFFDVIARMSKMGLMCQHLKV
jgi:hypothetical protein